MWIPGSEAALLAHMLIKKDIIETIQEASREEARWFSDIRHVECP